jgi:hypothetical protein
LYIREWRSHLAVVWLCCQVASIGFAATSLPHPAAFAAAVTTCTCPGDHTDEACPMHQSGGGASDDCSMRSAHAPTDAALLSLTAGLGIPASSSGLDTVDPRRRGRLRQLHRFPRLPTSSRLKPRI